MLFTNPNPNKEACVYVRAHALDLAAWEDAQSLALLGLVNRRPVIGHDVRTAPTTTSPSASASASASEKQRARARSTTSATFAGGAEAAIEDGSLNTFVATPLFNLDVDELSAVAAWLDSAIVKANMCLIEGQSCIHIHACICNTTRRSLVNSRGPSNSLHHTMTHHYDSSL